MHTFANRTPELEHHHYHRLELDAKNAYRLVPRQLETLLSRLGAGQHLLVLNNPHNPTGVVYSAAELEAIVEVCRRHGTLVVADEIYALTTYDLSRFASLGTLYPEGAFVTNGLSKDRAAGGYRLGVCILPEGAGEGVRDAFVKVAATLNTNVSTPVQYAAVEAYRESVALDRYFAATREIHAMVGRFMSGEINKKVDGLQATVPEGGFYCFVDFNALSEDLQRHGVWTSNELAARMLDCPFHTAAITGDAVMLEADDFGARLAFVDYDGTRMLDAYLEDPPRTGGEDRFVREHAPRIAGAVEVLGDFVDEVRSSAPEFHPVSVRG